MTASEIEIISKGRQKDSDPTRLDSDNDDNDPEL